MIQCIGTSEKKKGCKFYQAIDVYGTRYNIGDSAWIKLGDNGESLGFVRIENIIEDRNSKKLVNMRWYKKPTEVLKEVVNNFLEFPRELFITNLYDKKPAEYLSGKISVVSYSTYRKEEKAKNHKHMYFCRKAYDTYSKQISVLPDHFFPSEDEADSSSSSSSNSDDESETKSRKRKRKASPQSKKPNKKRKTKR
eukprot:TRINITY_DN5860_c0_g1_i1.p1 TRINITY_DN5860_c0_g1~~TRINITY_DN5860_c0_g1_i1.p1  ORF type:complete len:195 (-),score=35.47 TRINITY_DN5860_c0_g1_i1:31-615(-)